MRDFVLKCVVVFISCLLFANVEVMSQENRKLLDSYSTIVTEDDGFQWIYTAKKYKKKKHEYTCFYSVSLMDSVELNCYHDGLGKDCELEKIPHSIKVADLGWAVYVNGLYGGGLLYSSTGDYIGSAPWSLSQLTDSSNPLILTALTTKKSGDDRAGIIYRLIVVNDNKIIINSNFNKDREYSKYGFRTFTYNSGFYFGEWRRSVDDYTIYSDEGRVIVERANDIEIIKNQVDGCLLMCREYCKDGKDSWKDCGCIVIDNHGRIIVPSCSEVTVIDGDNGEKLFKARIGANSSNVKYGIYDCAGNVVIPCEYKEITSIDNNGEKLFKVEHGKYSSHYGIYNAFGKMLISCEYQDILVIDGMEGEKLLKVKSGSSSKFGIYYVSGRVLIPCEYSDISIIDDERGEKLFKIQKGNERGLYDYVGNEILAPDFQDCDYLGNNLFSFKMNGYWGVMDRQGKIIIPISRHYTSIDYSRTLKIFTFTKETETGYFKGECNDNGVQTSIAKVQTKKENVVTNNTTKPNTSTSSTQTSTSSSSNSNSKSNNVKEQGLLYKGEYTLRLSQSKELNSGYSVGEYSSDETETISIYEDLIKINNVTCNYESTNSNGERVYKGSSLGTVTVYVSPTYEIRYYDESFFNGHVMRVTFPVVKGRSSMSNDNGGGNNAGTYTSPTQPSQPKIEKEQRQPKMPHTTYKTCYMCHGDGVCSSCNGKGWFYNSYGTGTVTCPNCSNGKCSTCNGTGKVLGPTEWY